MLDCATILGGMLESYQNALPSGSGLALAPLVPELSSFIGWNGYHDNSGMCEK